MLYRLFCVGLLITVIGQQNYKSYCKIHLYMLNRLYVCVCILRIRRL